LGVCVGPPGPTLPMRNGRTPLLSLARDTNPPPSRHLGDKHGTVVNARGDGTVDVRWDVDCYWASDEGTSERRSASELWPEVSNENGSPAPSVASCSSDDDSVGVPPPLAPADNFTRANSILKRPTMGDAKQRRRRRRVWSLTAVLGFRSRSKSPVLGGNDEGKAPQRRERAQRRERSRSVSFNDNVEAIESLVKLDEGMCRALWYSEPDINRFISETGGVKGTGGLPKQ